MEPSIRFTAFVKIDGVGPLTRTHFASVLVAPGVSVDLPFPAAFFVSLDKAEGGRITEGTLKMGICVCGASGTSDPHLALQLRMESVSGLANVSQVGGTAD